MFRGIKPGTSTWPVWRQVPGGVRCASCTKACRSRFDVFEAGAGRVSWLDSAMSEPYALQLEPVALRLQGLDLAADRPALIEMTAAGEGMQDIAFQGRQSVSC